MCKGESSTERSAQSGSPCVNFSEEEGEGDKKRRMSWMLGGERHVPGEVAITPDSARLIMAFGRCLPFVLFDGGVQFNSETRRIASMVFICASQPIFLPTLPTPFPTTLTTT